MNEIADVRAATDEVVRSKASAEKSHRLKVNLCQISEFFMLNIDYFHLWFLGKSSAAD